MKRLFLILSAVCMSNTNTKAELLYKENQNCYTVLILLNATPQWLSLSRDERSAFFEKEVIRSFRRLAIRLRSVV